MITMEFQPYFDVYIPGADDSLKMRVRTLRDAKKTATHFMKKSGEMAIISKVINYECHLQEGD